MANCPLFFSCLPNMLCQINYRVKTTGTRLQMLIHKSLAAFAAWALSYDGSLDWKILNEALAKGSKKENCDLIFNNNLANVKRCHIFPWQSKLHEEL
jgi:hypothetical protein